jgi:hypothetical protein
LVDIGDEDLSAAYFPRPVTRPPNLLGGGPNHSHDHNPRVYSNAFKGHSHHMIDLSEQQMINQLADRLANVYAGVESADVSRIVHKEYARFEGRPIHDFIPLFVERNAKAELSKLVA